MATKYGEAGPGGQIPRGRRGRKLCRRADVLHQERARRKLEMAGIPVRPVRNLRRLRHRERHPGEFRGPGGQRPFRHSRAGHGRSADRADRPSHHRRHQAVGRSRGQAGAADGGAVRHRCADHHHRQYRPASGRAGPDFQRCLHRHGGDRRVRRFDDHAGRAVRRGAGYLLQRGGARHGADRARRPRRRTTRSARARSACSVPSSTPS